MGSRRWRYIAVLGLIALFGVALHATLTARNLLAGIAAGKPLPPFAAPLAIGGPRGEVDVATHAGEGQAGQRPACAVRGQGILNICELYERGPVVLALFIDAGSCANILSDMQRLVPSFPQVEFAAVAIREERAPVAKLVRSKRLSFPVGVDQEGRLGGLYSMLSCPQVTFAYPGGVVQGSTLLDNVSIGALRARVRALLAASLARGWKPSAGPERSA